MLSHDELIARAIKWLLSQGCGVVLSEIKCWNDTGEIVDAIGFTSSYSILVEAKASRSDFLSDKRKRFRMKPELGVGELRFYMANKGIIKPEDLPDRWGLLEIQKSQIKKTVHPDSKYLPHLQRDWWHKANLESERSMLLSACRRLGEFEQGINGKIFFKGKEAS